MAATFEPLNNQRFFSKQELCLVGRKGGNDKIVTNVF